MGVEQVADGPQLRGTTRLDQEPKRAMRSGGVFHEKEGMSPRGREIAIRCLA
jgi:hypothetical protein